MLHRNMIGHNVSRDNNNNIMEIFHGRNYRSFRYAVYEICSTIDKKKIEGRF